jgi:signal transduction histidine kinase
LALRARRHGGAVRTDVHIDYATDEVRLTVLNDLPAEQGSVEDRTESGQGLVGMRERVAMYAGRLEVGRFGDRFRVDVRVPAP